MKSSLKKSLYLGLAAASFVAAAGATGATASAKTYATAGAYSTLTAPSTSRNVNLTGNNAIYSKPGTVKGAKVVASTTTVAKLSKSTNGENNFRAYGVKTTNRGSVYFKVVSFDKTYRGYVYGGKSTSAFAGGLTSYATTKDATAPSSTATFNLTADTSSTANTLFYKAPAWTQYKVGRARVNGTGSIIASTDTYKGATFTFDKAVTTSREGDTWYEISSTKLSNGSTSTDLNGAWVKASNVSNPKADPEATDANSVYVNYALSNGNSVGTAASKFVATSTPSGSTIANNEDVNAKATNNAGDTLASFASKNVPSGYTLDPATQTPTAKFGGTVTYTVSAAATSKATLYSSVQNGTTDVQTPLAKSALTNTPALPSAEQAKLTGPKGTTIPAATVTELAYYLAYGNGTGTGAKITFYGTNNNGSYATYTVNMDKTKTANEKTAYGDTFKIVLDKGADVSTLPTTPDSGNSDFLN